MVKYILKKQVQNGKNKMDHEAEYDVIVDGAVDINDRFQETFCMHDNAEKRRSN